MSEVEVQKISEPKDRSLPVFAEFQKIADEIRMQAYNLFAHRGRGDGHALDDWLAAEREVCWPAAELAEQDGGYTLKLALAGFEPEDVDVTATPHEIMVKATHRHEASGEETELRWSEFRSNDVYRRVELPEAVNVDGMSASLKNGMLEITAPKAEAQGASAEKIPVSVPS